MNSFLHLFHLAANGCNTKTGVLPSLFDKLCAPGTSDVTINSLEDVGTIIANIVRILMALAGSFAIILILVAAVYYVTSAGDPARVKRAKDILVNTVIGLVIVIAAYAIVTFIAGEF